MPIKPQPAARPRVTRWGAHFPKNYTEFKKEAHIWLKKQKDLPESSTGEFRVTIELICKKPKKPSNPYPRGDVDNYVKAYLDSITKAGKFWIDDIQIVELHTMKRYQEDSEEFGAYIQIEKLESNWMKLWKKIWSLKDLI